MIIRSLTSSGPGRALAAGLTVVVAGAVLGAPGTARAEVDAIPVKVSAPKVVKSWKTGKVPLTAVYDDPGDRMAAVKFRVTVPDSFVTRPQNVMAYGATSTSGIRKTFADDFTIDFAYRPGVYRYDAVPVYRQGTSFVDGTQRITGSFVVRHKGFTSFSPTGGWDVGERTRFRGEISTPTTKRLKVVVQFKAKGAKKFRKVGKAITAKKSGAWRSPQYRLTRPGAWRAKVLRKGYVVAGTSLPMKIRRR